MDIQYVIKRPLITEKLTLQKGEENKYCFKVDPAATKIDIRRAVEAMFKVDVRDVRTITLHTGSKMNNRTRRLIPSQIWKKAIVTLEKGNKIELFEGV